MRYPRGYIVFMCYAPMDEQFAKAIERALERCFSVRLFRALSLSSSPDLPPEVRYDISQSDAMVVLVSPAAAQSRSVSRQVAEWIRLGRDDRLVPIWVGEWSADEPRVLHWDDGARASSQVSELLDRPRVDLRGLAPELMAHRRDFLVGTVAQARFFSAMARVVEAITGEPFKPSDAEKRITDDSPPTWGLAEASRPDELSNSTPRPASRRSEMPEPGSDVSRLGRGSRAFAWLWRILPIPPYRRGTASELPRDVLVDDVHFTLVSCLRKSLVLRSRHRYAARHAEKTSPQADRAD